MARVVVKIAKGPHEVKPSKKSVFICMCGLSKNQPFCDGSHNKTLDEKDDELYQYDEKGKRMEECCEDDHEHEHDHEDKKEGGCCGGGCCGDKKDK